MTRRLQVVVDDRLADAVKALAGREGRSVSEWVRILLDGVVARAEVRGLMIEGRCVGCGGEAGQGELVCRGCADLLAAEDTAPSVKERPAREATPPTRSPSQKARGTNSRMSQVSGPERRTHVEPILKATDR